MISGDSGASLNTGDSSESPANLRLRIEDFCENWERVLLADGHEDSFMGVLCWSSGNETPKAVYSLPKLLKGLEADMSPEDAQEHFDFNIGGAYVGPETPVFLIPFEGNEEEKILGTGD